MEIFNCPKCEDDRTDETADISKGNSSLLGAEQNVAGEASDEMLASMWIRCSF